MKTTTHVMNSEKRISRQAGIKKAFVLFVLSICLLGSYQTYANNLSLTNISVSQANQTVAFNIQWDNSWRITTNDAPYNWDAVWIFVKFRDCSATPSTQFTQGTVSTAVGDHSFGSLEPMESAGLTTGSASGVIDATQNTGVMLRRNSDGQGTMNTSVTLKITNLPSSGTIDTRVFGIEMVFIPSGSFTMGDGNGSSTTCANGSVTATSYTSYSGVTIGSENALTVYEKDRYYYTNILGSSACASFAISAGFPKGYNAYYVMKYEITQGQYADFLNTIPFSHFPAQDGVNRNRINNTGTPPNVFNCLVSSVSKDDRACNWLSWNNITAYLDWACLRPMTEFEFEKTCRGFQGSAALEFAWATLNAYPATTITGTENGTETISNVSANVSAGGGGLSGGDGGSGPLRAGIFATSSTTTRQETGASYFGVMEMSGNVMEFCVALYAGMSSTGSCFSASGISNSGMGIGDGMLDGATGSHDVSGWPNPTAPANNIIKRGGSWATSSCNSNSASCQLEVSNRHVNNIGSFAPAADSGGRGVRN
jgi:formylglycine-generating enzyme required for sulfatase activity